ncbi:hypothetical protein Y1Q_0021320 [Alligator mississippiensis]|uniref:Uncharacterized protein n=1 Tax=Alligator mississippiensis TaxID=8496 RepID=A0A151P961_ALLMI|nr:hypothetical protein Y1Q_0021320 [Alligator mississippiensis]
MKGGPVCPIPRRSSFWPGEANSDGSGIALVFTRLVLAVAFKTSALSHPGDYKPITEVHRALVEIIRII